MGIARMSGTRIREFDRQRGQHEVYRGAEYGDGKVFTSPVREVVRISTGEMG